MHQPQNLRPSFIPFLLALLLLSGELFLVAWLPQPGWISKISWLHTTLFWGLWIVSCFFLFAPVWVLRKHGGVRKSATYVETEKLVTTSLYSIVRHPQYLGWLLMYWALACFNPQWLCAIFTLVGSGTLILAVHQEDRYLVQKFGQAYQRYQKEVPALDLIGGTLRYFRSRSNRNT